MLVGCFLMLFVIFQPISRKYGAVVRSALTSGLSRGGKGGGSFPGPHNVCGGLPSLINTEKVVPDGF